QCREPDIVPAGLHVRPGPHVDHSPASVDQPAGLMLHRRKPLLRCPAFCRIRELPAHPVIFLMPLCTAFRPPVVPLLVVQAFFAYARRL
ncbi:MAG: hypothetical protein ACK53Y_19820, partial [bacterium]